MDIQVWSDVVCPWCYIGKRRLEAAVREFPGDVTVTFRAYQLDPSPVSPGRPIRQALEAEFGDSERAEEMFTHVTTLAAGDGITIDFNRAISANSFDAHRLIVWAAGQDRQSDMLEALQRAHFTDGVDLGSRPALAGVAAGLGLDRAAALDYLNSEAGAAAVNADLTAARELNITSVPFFLIDGKYAAQGAQEPAVLLEMFAEVTHREDVDAGR